MTWKQAAFLLLVASGVSPARLAAQTLSVASSAQPTGAGESTLRRADLRVARVAYRLALAGRPLCPSPWPLTGMLLHHLAEYEPADRAQVIQRYGVDRGPGVLSVVGGSPADKAGLIAGDVLLAVNGVPLPSPTQIAAIRERSVWRPRLEATEMQFEEALRRGPADLLVLRQGNELRLRLDSLPACVGRIRLARSTQTNAFASGTYVIMTTSMLDFVRSDDELAVVLGHEMAHDILGHPATRSEEGVLAGLGIHPNNIWKREAEADRFGLRLMAAAGYNLDAAIPFWRRYLGKFDWFPQIFRSHPSLGAREKIAEEEIAAIRAGVPYKATAGS